jgi:hypothetical protein
MDFPTALTLITKQTTTNGTEPDAFLVRLSQQQPPIPGQVTSLLLALKVISDHLKATPTIERPLIDALYRLAHDGRQFFEAGRRAGVEWPPLLDEDLERLAVAVGKIFAP